MSIITLTTDFGVEDEYAGIIKGVMLSVNPSAVLIDITHSIEPQNLIQAAYIIKHSFKYFPAGTIHVIIVDPQVGGKRAIIALQIKEHIFLAPDNGVLTLLLNEGDFDSIIRVENPRYFLEPVSQTFHGRDIFAPVAGHLSKGVKIDELGTRIHKSNLKILDFGYPCISNNRQITGTVVSIDRFGNLITNIEAGTLDKLCKTSERKSLKIITGRTKSIGLYKNYENVPPQQPLALIGSRGCLEIAVNCGSASNYFKAGTGDPVIVIKK